MFRLDARLDRGLAGRPIVCNLRLVVAGLITSSDAHHALTQGPDALSGCPQNKRTLRVNTGGAFPVSA